MKTLSKLFLSGLLAIIPITLTIYILYWFGSSAENLFGTVLKVALPEGYYFRGLGLISGFVLIISAGVLLRAWIFHRLFVWGESLLARLPMVRTVYSAIRDLMKFVSKPGGTQHGQVVLVTFHEKNINLIGFLTCENVHRVHSSLPDGYVSVYMPMSYMIGGCTIIVPATAVKPIDMPMNEAMKFSMTAGMVAAKNNVDEYIAPPK